MTLAARFMNLKTKIGGNREKLGYEDTFGPAREENFLVTRPNAFITRIISEISFALQLSEANEGKFAPEIEAAIAILENEMAENGVLTKAACLKAEQAIMPLQNAAKEYEVIYAAHAHIDMNWMWGWQETVAATLATFRTMLHLMEEYPQFTFSQSQGSVYKIVEKYDPKMMEEIKKRIQEGRWEITASAWVETDKNMPDTESLLHHITVTREYLRDVWGVDPDSVEVDFSPDTFGHSRFVPEINRFENVKYYYHCRGLEEIETLYRYRAPSGAEVLMYKEPYWYNSAVNPDNGTGIIGLSKRCGGLKTGLVVYGVGDHGGGPTRRDVEKVLEMQQWPVFPALKFGTLREFFKKAESVWDNLTVVEHELNPLFAGCYTTQSRVKLGNRKSEIALNDAAKMCALGGKVAEVDYPEDRFAEAWQDVLFTHFHDILTGSCVQESREHAMGLFADALSYAQTAQSNALRVLSENIDTLSLKGEEDISDAQAEGAGVGYGLDAYGGVPNPERGAGKTRVYTVFNTASTERCEQVTITMWDYVGDLRRLEVLDHAGNVLPFELLTGQERYWDHRYVKLTATVTVPALGYTTLAVREKEAESYPTFYQDDIRIEKPRGPVMLENEYIRAEIGLDGKITSMLDKETGVEQLSAPAGLSCVMTEHDTSNAWNIGRYFNILPVEKTVKLRPVMRKLSQSVEIEQKIMASTVKTTITLEKGAKQLHFAFEVDWNEAAKQQDQVPVLTYRVPVNGGAKKLLRDVPAGSMIREADHVDYPGLTFAAALGETAKPVLFTDCKYGYRLADDVLTATLINTAGSPDPYPERGIHKIQMWLGVSNGCAVALKKRGEALLRPMIAMPTGAHPGKLAKEASLMQMEAKHSVLSAVEKDAEGKLTIRAYEMEGAAERVTVILPVEAKGATVRGGKDVVCDGNRVSFEIPAYSLAEVKII